MTLREFIESASDGVDRIFSAKGAVGPMWHYVDRVGNEIVMPAPRMPKDLALMLMRAVFEVSGATRCLFIDEAWVAHISTAADAAAMQAWRAAGREIRDHPDRVECVLFCGEDEREGLLMARREFDRSGDKPKLGPLKFYEADGFEGRMVGMLPRKGGLQ